MHEWAITTALGEQTVQAHVCSISHCGALLFTSNGSLCMAFAHGQWLRCEIKRSLPGGYGG